MGLTTWQKQLSTQKSAKENKRVQEKRHKLKGEVALQREILAKAEKKAARQAEKKAAKKAAHRAAKVGDQEAEAVMEAQDKDYPPQSGSEASESDSSSSGSGSSTSGIAVGTPTQNAKRLETQNDSKRETSQHASQNDYKNGHVVA